MRIKFVDTVNGARVLPFVHLAWGALMAEGLWSKTEMLINGSEHCFYAVIDRKIVGCIVYRIDEDSKLAIIAIAYVVPKMRGKGVYKALHQAFELKAKEQSATHAVNICYPSNEGIQKTCKQLGYEMYTQEWRKAL